MWSDGYVITCEQALCVLIGGGKNEQLSRRDQRIFFGSKEDFVQNYKNLSSFNQNKLANLHMELRPYILRRVIKEVEKSLPTKVECIVRVEMSPLQKQYYKWILKHNFHDLNEEVRGNQVSLLNIVVELKKCCNHPFLFESAYYGYGEHTRINDNSKLERIILSSGKLVILDKLLVRLHETKHRILIFSQVQFRGLRTVYDL